MVSLLTRTLCAVLGGHEWQGPKSVNGRLRLVCGLGCGAMSAGLETRGQELQRAVDEAPINLLSYRSDRNVWRKREKVA